MTISTIANLEPWERELLAASSVARLGLLDDHSHPRVLPITFALHDGCIWSAIDSKPKRSTQPARLRYLRERPQAAVTVDRYEDDWSLLAWVQLLCAASIVEAEGSADARAALDALAAKYTQYREDPPPGPLMRFEPRSATSWRAASGGS